MFRRQPPGVPLRVASYNVLSPNLCSPRDHPFCQPEACDADTRLGLVLAQLAKEADARAVICLQEVAIRWSGPMHAFFASKGYNLVLTQYGGAFNGFMGVGVAYPTDRFDLVDAQVSRLSDTREPRWPREPKKEGTELMLQQVKDAGRGVLGWTAAPFKAVWRLVTGGGGRKPFNKAEVDPWEYSMKRFNFAVFARLRDKASGRSAAVVTYHMPCVYWSQPVMVIHTAMASQAAHRFADGDPLVLCGDWNFKPRESPYALVTTGRLPEGCEDAPVPREWDASGWEPSTPSGLRSAYAVANGEEPDFTNFGQMKGMDEPFIDCLDYIFVSDGVGVDGVKPLPHRSDVTGPFPSAAEPSDHLLIAADLRLLPQ